MIPLYEVNSWVVLPMRLADDLETDQSFPSFVPLTPLRLTCSPDPVNAYTQIKPLLTTRAKAKHFLSASGWKQAGKQSCKKR